MGTLDGRTVALLAADGSEQVEVTAPRDALKRAGATVLVCSPDGDDVRGYHYIEPGDQIPVDESISGLDPADIDALVLPGGLGGPDTLRKEKAATDLVRSAFERNCLVGVICHGPWLLVDAVVIEGRTLTCVRQLANDVRNAGAQYVDEDVHVDRNGNVLVSSRNHDTAPQFAQALVEELARR